MPNDTILLVADSPTEMKLVVTALQSKGYRVITAVDGAPDIEASLKDPNSPQIHASASQDPYAMAQLAVRLGVDALNGKKPAQTVTLMESKLVTRDNVKDYKGWSSPR